MKFLVDRCTGPSVVQLLRAAGHDVLDAYSIDPDPGDDILLEIAVREQRIVVTMDSDFGTLVYRDHHQHAGLVRLENVSIADRLELMQLLLSNHGDDLANGSIITADLSQIRVTDKDRT